MTVEYKFNLPVSYKLGRTDRAKRLFHVNMNVYRNKFGTVLNDAKVRFKEEIEDQLAQCPRFDKPIKITYKWFPVDNARRDMDNVMAVMKKFFQDALMDYGIIDDDDGTMIMMNVEVVGHVDPDNARVEAHIETLSDDWVEANSMQAQLLRHQLGLVQRFREDMSDSGEGMIDADLFKKHFGINTLNKKQIRSVLNEWFGFKEFTHQRVKKLIVFTECQ